MVGVSLDWGGVCQRSVVSQGCNILRQDFDAGLIVRSCQRIVLLRRERVSELSRSPMDGLNLELPELLLCCESWPAQMNFWRGDWGSARTRESRKLLTRVTADDGEEVEVVLLREDCGRCRRDDCGQRENGCSSLTFGLSPSRPLDSPAAGAVDPCSPARCTLGPIPSHRFSQCWPRALLATRMPML